MKNFKVSIAGICKYHKIQLLSGCTLIQSCPKCGGEVKRKEISNIQIKNIESTLATERHLGIYQCLGCSTKFTTRSLILASVLYPELLYISKHNGAKLHLRFKFAEQRKTIEKKNNCEDCIGKMWIREREKLCEYTIIEDYKKQESSRGKLWVGRGMIQDAITAIATGTRKIGLNGERIIEEWEGIKLKEEIDKRKKLCNPQTKTEVILYDGKLPCHPKIEESVTALIYCTRSEQPVRMSIHYCRKCDRYYINAQSYQQYAEKYGLPMLRVTTWKNHFGNGDYSEWNKESELAAYGYSAGENSGAIDSDRQRLLADLVDSGLMTKSEIVQWIEFLIRTRKNLDSLIVQKRRKDDLEFLNQYHINEQRFVWAKITPNKKRRR